MIRPLLSALLEHRRFVIATHIRPDGDALGSQVALGRFLQKLGRDVLLINSDPPPTNLGWLPGAREIEVYDGSIRQRQQIDEAETVVIVDTNALNRLGDVAGPVKHSAARKVLIDHHPQPETWFDLTLSDAAASSTGELIYRLIHAHDPDLIDADLAVALYTAIMTDTGSFRYSSTTPAVHHVAGDLLARGGFSPETVHRALYDTRSLASLRLLAMALDTITLRHRGRVGYMILAQQMLSDTGTTMEDAEGFVNYVLSLETVQAALLFSDTASGTKISFRSKDDVSVNQWARAFGGGGHRNAAGAYVERPLDEVLEDVLDAAPTFVDLDDPPEDPGRGANGLSADDAAYLATLLSLKDQDTSS